MLPYTKFQEVEENKRCFLIGQKQDSYYMSYPGHSVTLEKKTGRIVKSYNIGIWNEFLKEINILWGLGKWSGFVVLFWGFLLVVFLMGPVMGDSKSARWNESAKPD